MPHHDHPTWLLDERRRLGDRVRERRMWCNSTQEGLAARAGISRDTVQRIEHATNIPRLSDLLRIARALQTRLADLLQEVAPASRRGTAGRDNRPARGWPADAAADG
ncbi:helix-turn-helix transcriptional regulator [Streptomyces sp. NPDC018352]|uniref:helix-turn-helix transcriptional regulator n=1 Tax=Streptomyces sp. NPDC018352 TaxID=3157194 RepID=UPI00340D9871